MNYIFSQIFILINYLISIATYQCKNRKTILILNLLATFATATSYILLSAYTGLAMTVVATTRNILFLLNKKKNQNKITLIFLYVLTILLTIFTYDGILSLMTVFATVIYTYSIWQTNTKIYKILGIPVGLVAIIYNIYILSVVGIVFESMITISAILGYIKENKKRKKLYHTLKLQTQN